MTDDPIRPGTMRFDPARHHRRSMRLPDYDYRTAGLYFVTICVHARECLLGEVTAGGQVEQSELGQVVQSAWLAVPRCVRSARLDEFVVMPNHFHGLLELAAAEPQAAAQRGAPRPAHGTVPGSLAAIVQMFKSVSTRRINALRRTPGARVWQRGYWEHVVRNEAELQALRRYIQENGLRWAMDRLNPQNAPTNSLVTRNARPSDR
jgi:REP element-mobilizing transposase RayT